MYIKIIKNLELITTYYSLRILVTFYGLRSYIVILIIIFLTVHGYKNIFSLNGMGPMLIDTTYSTFSQKDLGTFTLVPLDIEVGRDLIINWVKSEHTKFWCMREMDNKEIFEFYKKMQESSHSTAYMGRLNSEPIFLLEVYDPEFDEINKHYEVKDGDIGMHFLIAPKQSSPIHGLSQSILQIIIKFIFSNSSASRVIVEPDVNNKKIHVLNKKIGFIYQYPINLSYKIGYLAFLEKEDFKFKY